MVFFYLLRVLTLQTFPPAYFILTKNIESRDYSLALKTVIIFIIPLYIFLYKLRDFEIKKIEMKSPQNFYAVFLLVSFSCLNYLLIGSSISFVSLISTYIGLVFQKDIVFFFSIFYFVTHGDKLVKKQKILVLFLVVIYILVDTLTGNKSGFFKVFFCFLYSLAMVRPSLKLNILLFFKGFIFLPVAIYFFFLANFVRDINRQGMSVEFFALLEQLDTKYFVEYGELGLGQITGRIGFLDYTAAIIKNHHAYNDIFNLKYYIGATVDYMLPMGNPFDYLRVSNAVHAVDLFGYLPSYTIFFKSSEYHSDMITLFAEFFNLGNGLFGGFILLTTLIFLILFFLKYYINNVKNALNYNFVFAIIIYSFFELFLNSFGLDWSISSLIYMLIFIRITKNIYAK